MTCRVIPGDLPGRWFRDFSPGLAEDDSRQHTRDASMETHQQLGSFITGSPEPTAHEKIWGAIAHASPVLLSALGPLIVLFLKGKQSAWVERQAKEALNFHLTVLAVSVALLVAGLLLFCFGGFLLWKLLAPLGLGVAVLSVYAGIKAHEGVLYRYPFNVRLVK
jgi:hypothetical protein